MSNMNGIIGKVIYFWIFILGGVFIAKVMGFADDTSSFVTLLVAIALVYIVFQVARTKGKKKRAEQNVADMPGVKVSGVSGAKKKKKKK